MRPIRAIKGQISDLKTKTILALILFVLNQINLLPKFRISVSSLRNQNHGYQGNISGQLNEMILSYMDFFLAAAETTKQLGSKETTRSNF